MRVVVLGGYGVFGTKLVRLLIRDGHDVVVAGRAAARAQALATEVGAAALVVDRQGDLAPLWEAAPDAVVDAAGPFHAYGDDPYALARACIAQGVHYLDLADDPAFCAGIGLLDKAAAKAGVFALSGVSSVPAISSAVVAALADGMTQIDMIDTAILPGNRAPRGRAVVASILHQNGKPFDTLVDAVSVPVRSWSAPDSFDLGQGIVRKAWMIEVPDHRLFGPYFGARTVAFRAGMELGVMNYGLAALSWLRGRLGFGMAGWFVRLMVWLARLLWPFGTDQGGMSVAVTGQGPDGWRRKVWRLVATGGEGPFIPAVAARVILRDPGQIKPGARPAIAAVPLAAVEAGMADLAVTTEVLETPAVPLFRRQLGDDFAQLPHVVQEAHQVYGPRRWAGQGRVTRGGSLWARMLAVLFGFPPAADAVPVTVTMTPKAGGELWERRFGDKVFRSYLTERGGHMTERFGPFTFTLGLHVADDRLHFPVLSGRLGPLPLPRLLLPQSQAQEYAQEGQFYFDVALKAPLTGGLMVHYQGWLARENPSTAS